MVHEIMRYFHLLDLPSLILYRILLIAVLSDLTDRGVSSSSCVLCLVVLLYLHCRSRWVEIANRGASSSSCVLCVVFPSAHTVGRASRFERVREFAPRARILDFFLIRTPRFANRVHELEVCRSTVST